DACVGVDDARHKSGEKYINAFAGKPIPSQTMVKGIQETGGMDGLTQRWDG
ncbi:hypothetical protein EVA_14686, partial [gut metagenome]